MTKTVLVTGGTSGMGKAMAIALKEAGWNVVVTGRNAERLQQTDQDLQAIDGKHSVIQMDVRDPDACLAAVNQTRQQYGQLEALINNAAGNFICPTDELSPNGWKTVIDIVLNGTFNCSHALVKGWQEDNVSGGQILNIVASYAWQAGPGVAPSAAAKAGVLNLTRTLAVEWGYKYGARINAISPGPIERTGGADKLAMSPEHAERIRRNVPLGRFGTPEEIAGLATWMLSDQASYLNGECIALDGGHWLNKQPF
ncbi:2,4-dienoyl-CoA reductase [Exiguobacterium sp. Helios]|uniref:2,4-dienoyl-CoA reductase n=1 Tax=Exiguobacterium sp. Helios TaxID=2735868 RepID=UPI00165D4E0C|nr:2,4-dienoyl-CoA reductase [Exiguobacterium sp. Helios]QNR20555.1 2,4-dienoyl-CoA reductase [Exiguobacterium sp. Helios]